MLKRKNNSDEKVELMKDSGSRRRGLYTFEYEQEAAAWDKLFPSKKEIIGLISKNENLDKFINMEALMALTDRRSGNFINPVFIDMLDTRLNEFGYSMVDECRKHGVPENIILQHINYYYDHMVILIENFKQSEFDYYNSRYDLSEQDTLDGSQYADSVTKDCYDFVNSSKERIYEANKAANPEMQ